MRTSSPIPCRDFRRGRAAALFVYGLLSVTSPGAAGAAASSEETAVTVTLAGRRLDEALQLLATEGLPLVFSSGVVTPRMRVQDEPSGDTPRQRLDALLAPHGLAVRETLGSLVVVQAPPQHAELRGRVTGAGRPLGGVVVSLAENGVRGVSDADGRFRLSGLAAGTYTLEARRPGFVIGRWPGVEAVPGTGTELALELVEAPILGEELVVRSARDDGVAEAIEPRSIPRDRLAILPHQGDDALRAAGLLPGATTSESSSRVRVRGGRDDEVLLLLDGLELRAPYHLQEFDSALSIVAPTSLAGVDLVTGGYPAEYGGRMGGVLDMTTVPPTDRFHAAVGVGSYYGQASASGRLGNDRGGWFAVGRAGNYRLALEIAGRPADPRYWDLFGKIDLEAAPGHELGFKVLMAEDEFEQGRAPTAGGMPTEGAFYGNRWASGYAWATWDALLGRRVLAQTVASYGRVERGRAGGESGTAGAFRLDDRRTVEIVGLKQGWTFLANAHWEVKGGFEVRSEEAVLDYHNERTLTSPLAAIRTTSAGGETVFADRIDGRQIGAYLSAPLRPRPDLTLELGLRFDRPAITGEKLVSPRFNLGWAPTDYDRLNAAWGWFYQDQRPDELQVEDGETGLTRAELSEHRMLGWEHRFESGARLGAEAFERWLSHPRPRYENLFDPLVLSPELSADRVRIAPERGRVRGLELSWWGAPRPRLSWSAVYILASAEDRLDGRWVPRSDDATHSLHADLGYRLPHSWTLGLVWSYSTGRPTTALAGRLITGADCQPGIEPVLGPLNGERLPAYHRLDLRLGREWKAGNGRLSAYLDLQNVYDRDNVRGFDDFAFATGADGAVSVRSTRESWGGFLPSFGIRWQY